MNDFIYVVIANGAIIGAYKYEQDAIDRKNRYNINREMGGYHDGYARICEIVVE